MKNKIKRKATCFVIALIFFCFNAEAQNPFSAIGGSTNGSWGTNGSSSSFGNLGLGNFTTANLPSVLTIDGNQTSFTSTDVFGTYAGSGTQVWHMWNGTFGSSPTEMFKITNASGSNNVALGTVQGGNLNFLTGNSQKMTLIGSGSTDDFLGIATSSPSFVLDIDGNATTTPTGDVFRTNGKSSAATYWKMRRGGSDYGILYNNNDNHFYIEAANGSGNMYFQTGGATTRMTILGTTNPGFVGVGITTPQNLLHLDNQTGPVAAGVYSQFTNFTTGNGSSSKGFLVGVNSNGDAVLNSNWLNATYGNMLFFTAGNATPSITILGNAGGTHGFVCIGNTTTAPARHLEVVDGSNTDQLRLSYNGTYHTDFLTTNNGRLIIRPTGHRVGIDETTPAATLDINPNTAENPLRLQDLATTGDDDFLVVNGSGDVFYRNIPDVVSNGCGTHNQNFIPKYCATTTSIQNSEIFDNGSGNIGVGAGNAPSQYYKLDVEPGSGLDGILISAVNAHTGIVINNTGSASGTNVSGIGINNSVATTGATANYGVSAIVSGSTNENNAIYGETTSTGNASVNHGVFGVASGSGALLNIGVYGTAFGATTNWAGYFNTDVQIQGDLWHGGSMIFSDQILKTDVSSIDNANEILLQVQPHSYYFDTVTYYYLNLPSSLQYGVVAEELEPVLSSSVSSTTIPAQFDSIGAMIHPSFDLKGVNYNSFIAILIKGYQDQQLQINNQQNQINSLQAQLDGCCGFGLRSSGSGNNGTSDQILELKSSQSPFLGNAQPNPHSTQATIPYSIPSEIGEAKIIFNDELGREVNSIDIIGRGKGQLTVMTSQLEDGVYTYSLIVDGKVIDTKKMMKSGH